METTLDYLKLCIILGCDNSQSYNEDCEKISELVLDANGMDGDERDSKMKIFATLSGIVTQKDCSAFLKKYTKRDDLHDAVVAKMMYLEQYSQSFANYAPKFRFLEAQEEGTQGDLEQLRLYGVMCYLGVGTGIDTRTAKKCLISCAYYSDNLSAKLLTVIDKDSSNFWRTIAQYSLLSFSDEFPAKHEERDFVGIMRCLKLEDGKLDLQLSKELLNAKSLMEKIQALRKYDVSLENFWLNQNRQYGF